MSTVNVELTPGEADVVRSALLSCYYLATDEAKTLARIKAESEPGSHDYKVADSGRAAAELRAFRYVELAEKVLRARLAAGEAPFVPEEQGREAIGRTQP